ncbi:hypothetical protein ElyMa_004662900 [Elysia marginata]|uniref:Uncharacterized protein n=1 Tax=Elysia marginata TaxID=1093978 RepID=A0AAV4I7Q6_9GAST|nr:hypothetical protein ElyMa_004662900 [Elysia marginata]
MYHGFHSLHVCSLNCNRFQVCHWLACGWLADSRPRAVCRLYRLVSRESRRQRVSSASPKFLVNCEQNLCSIYTTAAGSACIEGRGCCRVGRRVVAVCGVCGSRSSGGGSLGLDLMMLMMRMMVVAVV